MKTYMHVSNGEQKYTPKRIIVFKIISCQFIEHKSGIV